MKEQWTINARKHEELIKPRLADAKPGMTMIWGDVAIMNNGEGLFVFTRADCPGLPDELREHAEAAFADYEAKHPDYEPLEEEHEWVVFSTALGEGWLMLQCIGCGLHGTVDDPSREEWSQASHAPSQPYRWFEETRVTIHDEKPADHLYVQRKLLNAKKCERYARMIVPEPGDYERVWIEATRPKPTLTPEGRKELLELAVLAEAQGLCSTLFPVFVEGYQHDAGSEPSYVVRWFAKRIAKVGHCSPSVIATLLREIEKTAETAISDSDSANGEGE